MCEQENACAWQRTGAVSHACTAITTCAVYLLKRPPVPDVAIRTRRQHVPFLTLLPHDVYCNSSKSKAQARQQREQQQQSCVLAVHAACSLFLPNCLLYVVAFLMKSITFITARSICKAAAKQANASAASSKLKWLWLCGCMPSLCTCSVFQLSLIHI